MERACLYVGLDPYLGLYHSERYGKPALVLDLVEEFRVPIVDSAVFPLFMKGVFKNKKSFVRVGKGEYHLSPDGKRRIVEALYMRLNEKIVWGGRRKTIKAIIEHQVRTLAQNFLGKCDRYHPFLYDTLVGKKT